MTLDALKVILSIPLGILDELGVGDHVTIVRTQPPSMRHATLVGIQFLEYVAGPVPFL